MVVHLAADHAGFELKEKVRDFLRKEGYQVEDHGTYEYDKNDDYPDFISLATEAISKDPDGRAIIFGSSGQGEAVVANKFKNVRAVVFYGPYTPNHNVDITGRVSGDPYEMIRLTREHNDANVLSLGARFLKEEDALKAVKLWLEAPFTNEERHVRRINKIKEIEQQN